MTTLEKLIQDGPDLEIAKKVVAAIEELFVHDAMLFLVDVNERAITHRLAFHLASKFPEWDTDCEYNRKGDMPKTLLLVQPVDATDSDGSRVFPDIIVHHRKKPENLLVIELKKSTSKISDEADHTKLRAYCDELGYDYGLFLCLASNTDKPKLSSASWYVPSNKKTAGQD